MTSKAKISAKTISVDVAIVGAGFGGLCMAIKLREAGNEDFVILEKAAEVGGAWYYNGYPGAACDVQSHLYSFSFAGKADWSKRYAPRDEIENYILDTVEQYQLRPFIQFNQEVNEAHFDSTTGTLDRAHRGGHDHRLPPLCAGVRPVACAERAQHQGPQALQGQGDAFRRVGSWL